MEDLRLLPQDPPCVASTSREVNLPPGARSERGRPFGGPEGGRVLEADSMGGGTPESRPGLLFLRPGTLYHWGPGRSLGTPDGSCTPGSSRTGHTSGDALLSGGK